VVFGESPPPGVRGGGASLCQPPPPGGAGEPLAIPYWTWVEYYFKVRSVANPSKTAGNNSANVPFEEALKKLEGIVEAMESDDLPLETLLAKYEEGSKLVKICREKLSEAELKIQQLEKNAAGEMKLKAFEDVEEVKD
jgi:exodeoxyribonuclease VII small subunit